MSDERYTDLFERSKYLKKYRATWFDLGWHGELQPIRATELKNSAVCESISRDVLKGLFCTTDVAGLGGRSAAFVLRVFLQQAATDNPSDVVIVQRTPRVVRAMRATGERLVKADPLPPKSVKEGDVGYLEPELWFYDSNCRLLMPHEAVRGFRRNPLRFCHQESGHPYMVERVRRLARVDGDVKFSSYVDAFIYATPTPEDLDQVRIAQSPIIDAPTMILDDGTRVIEQPTIMVYRVSARASAEDRYDNTRFGMNFSPQGDLLAAISMTHGDFHQFLDFYPGEFDACLRKALSR